MNHRLLAHPQLTKSLQQAPIIEKGDYDYLIHPLTDGVPRTDPGLLEEAANGLQALLHDVLQQDVDLLLTAEAMGLPLVTLLSHKTGIPYAIARKRSYGLPGEIGLDQVTGYSHTRLHLNDVNPGERLIIIDDLISTGGTLRALMAGVRQADAEPLAVAACVSKQQELGPLASELGCRVRALACVTITKGPEKRVEVTGTDLHGDPQ
jgi:adenine phosphoribosyltransferase